MHTESSHNDGDPIIEKKMSRSSSSASSASSFDPSENLGDGEKYIVDDWTSKSGQDSHISSGAFASPEVSAQVPEWSMISALPMAGPVPLSSADCFPQTPEHWSGINSSPIQSPPVQTMGRPGAGYDPNRIPSSVFNNKSTSPMEWSVTSNESLFSIHMGNNSFSKEHALFLGKSGELLRPDELHNSPLNLPTLIEVASDNHRKSSATSWEDYSGATDTEDETPKAKKTAGDCREMPAADVARTSANIACVSDESGNSNSSFAFPV